MAHGKTLELRKIKPQSELTPIRLFPVDYANRHERRKAAVIARRTKGE